MLAMFDGFSSLDKFFVICAILGGALLSVRIVLQFLGLTAEHDFSSVDSSDISGAAHGHNASELGFKILSLQGLTAFFLMFGLVGLALSRQSSVGPFLSIAGATASGLLMVYIMAKIFTAMKRLQSSGNIDIKHAVGLPATVYANIPADSTGQVQLTIHDRLRIYDASAKDKTEIKTGSRVKVVEVIGNTLIVEKSV
ncbi:MAG: hypothetical protein A2Y07_10885 [Planctomycetes bacterium GWF2_50_10]|nr:MAG: hypothetical protein A2Y07_10885 [Planctomycetes bacterium GWF2_50_10]